MSRIATQIQCSRAPRNAPHFDGAKARRTEDVNTRQPSDFAMRHKQGITTRLEKSDVDQNLMELRQRTLAHARRRCAHLRQRLQLGAAFSQSAALLPLHLSILDSWPPTGLELSCVAPFENSTHTRRYCSTPPLPMRALYERLCARARKRASSNRSFSANLANLRLKGLDVSSRRAHNECNRRP